MGGYPSMPCRSVLGGIPACLAGQSWGVGGLVPGGGVSPILGGDLVPGGLQFLGGSPIFRGVSNFLGGVSNCSGGLRGAKGRTPHHNFFWGGQFFFDFWFLWDMPPPPFPGPDTGIQSTFGWYASYWNAFLL